MGRALIHPDYVTADDVTPSNWVVVHGVANELWRRRSVKMREIEPTQPSRWATTAVFAECE